MGEAVIAEYKQCEMCEQFLDQLVDIVSMGGGGKLVSNLIVAVAATIEKETASILKLATASGIGAEMEIYGLKSHNPSDYTYYQFDWEWYLDAVDIQNVYIGLIDVDFDESDSCLIEKSATAGDIKFITTQGGGSTTTDNITVDITTKHIYTIKIKSGTVKFYIDGVLKATHTTNVPYSVADGLMFINYIESSAANSREWYIDAMSVKLGRAF